MTIIGMARRPEPKEYSDYHEKYISLIAGDDVLGALEQQRRDMILLLSGRSEQEGEIRYAPGKWTAKEVLGHINDTERIFAYRALRISRADQTPIEGFEHDDYIRNGPFAQCSLSSLVEDFIAVRRATISLFRNLTEEAWLRTGVANKNVVSVRAMAFIAAGHELHHQRILRQKYFVSSNN